MAVCSEFIMLTLQWLLDMSQFYVVIIILSQFVRPLYQKIQLNDRFYVIVEGFETARSLALHGAHVVLACRNMQSANRAVNAIKTENKCADVEAAFVDLTSLKTVENFACSYISRNMYASYSLIEFTLLNIYSYVLL